MWIAALYLAGIVTARWVGGLIVNAERQSLLVVLLIGLVVIAVASAIPILGGPIEFVTVVLGLGLLGRWVLDEWRGPEVAY